MRKLLILALAIAVPASANEISYRSLQSGWIGYTTPIFDHGIHGEGQIVAVLDTGLDWQSCYFAEPDNSRPPINTGSPVIGLAWESIDSSRRKVIAYDFLYSCDQFPDAQDCDDPALDSAYDNQGHGTHAAGSAVGDRDTPIVHDFGDAIAPGAKLIVQDAGLSAGDICTSRPGIGCPVNITPALDQAYRQGARIHSNSWGDHLSTTGAYSQPARDVDAFVYGHPDMLVVFNTGNFGQNSAPPASSLSAPGCAKNTLQVGGTRGYAGRDDSVLAGYSLVGPARDGRIKPDLVGPAYVVASDIDFDNNPLTCDATYQGGTSWSSPTIAGAAALVRQYYTDGFYPTGAASPWDALTPSAALMKATLIAAARRVPVRNFGGPDVASAPVPSSEQGWGFPVLADVLYFPGGRTKLRVADVPLSGGLSSGTSTSTPIDVNAGTPLKAVLVWTDPPGVVRAPSDPTPELVNDLDLRVTTPSGEVHFGNEAIHPGQRDHLNNVETITIAAPVTGTYIISVDATNISSGPRQSYALVITGDFAGDTQGTGKRHAALH